MSQDAILPPLDPPVAIETAARTRAALLKRLADVVCLPASRANGFERAMTGDLLVEALREASPGERERVAQRLAPFGDLPGPLVRLLLNDLIAVARPLLEEAVWLGDADLIDCARSAGPEHRRLIAQRREVGEALADVLAATGEGPALEALLRNDQAQLGHAAVEALAAASRRAPRLIPLLLRRPELRPSHACVIFWWCDAQTRWAILQRYAVSRDILRDALADIFPDPSGEAGADPMSRRTLAFIDRRQRNRAAIAQSPFDSLEAAVAAAQNGLTRETAEEISYLSGLKPMTGTKIFADPGGEPLAVLCKAAGLPRTAIRALWRGLRRPEADPSGAPTAAFERVLAVFDMIGLDQAQTVLRYWDWSLSSALTPALLQAVREGDEAATDEYSAAQRSSALALPTEFQR
ncbi:MAG: hypothetical protein JWP92_285 [Caulobacter sp.]|nr:hypothetical protein [Caulobacter sp.]